jgi:hypothetical protein
MVFFLASPKPRIRLRVALLPFLPTIRHPPAGKVRIAVSGQSQTIFGLLRWKTTKLFRKIEVDLIFFKNEWRSLFWPMTKNGVPTLLKLSSAQVLTSLNSKPRILGIGTAQALGIAKLSPIRLALAGRRLVLIFNSPATHPHHIACATRPKPDRKSSENFR